MKCGEIMKFLAIAQSKNSPPRKDKRLLALTTCRLYLIGLFLLWFSTGLPSSLPPNFRGCWGGHCAVLFILALTNFYGLKSILVKCSELQIHLLMVMSMRGISYNDWRYTCLLEPKIQVQLHLKNA